MRHNPVYIPTFPVQGKVCIVFKELFYKGMCYLYNYSLTPQMKFKIQIYTTYLLFRIDSRYHNIHVYIDNAH